MCSSHIANYSSKKTAPKNELNRLFESFETQEKTMRFAKVLAIIALAAISTGIVMNMRDIKRYIRIRNM